MFYYFYVNVLLLSFQCCPFHLSQWYRQSPFPQWIRFAFLLLLGYTCNSLELSSAWKHPILYTAFPLKCVLEEFGRVFFLLLYFHTKSLDIDSRLAVCSLCNGTSHHFNMLQLNGSLDKYRCIFTHEKEIIISEAQSDQVCPTHPKDVLHLKRLFSYVLRL